jgi:hypothetical protein
MHYPPRSKTCLVRFDNNKYSVNASAVGRPVEIHAYAERIIIRQDGHIVGNIAAALARARRSMTMALRASAGRKPGACATGHHSGTGYCPPHWNACGVDSPVLTMAIGRCAVAST